MTARIPASSLASITASLAVLVLSSLLHRNDIERMRRIVMHPARSLDRIGRVLIEVRVTKHHPIPLTVVGWIALTGDALEAGREVMRHAR